MRRPASVGGQLYAFTPHFLEVEGYYIGADPDILVSAIEDEMRFVRNNWSLDGRPTLSLLLTARHFESPRCAADSRTGGGGGCTGCAHACRCSGLPYVIACEIPRAQEHQPVQPARVAAHRHVQLGARGRDTLPAVGQHRQR